MSQRNIVIIISKEPIRLGQFLKHANLVQDGFEAKIRIQNDEVFVNDLCENRRGKQLFHGDIVIFDNKSYQVQLKGTP
ncbi:MAG: RNA-binding S4 domain-containing protein [Desulfobacteraceae bacterium]|nr:RNA-binding S4 domain-containing protein [Desulfobacteraceae bacterium]